MLALGDLTFAGGGDGEVASLDGDVDGAASLLGVGAPRLREALLKTVVSSGRGSIYPVPLSAAACARLRDALAKAAYAALFEWIVARLNARMAAAAGAAAEHGFIGLLDVFGFENFEVNSLEQLCINFANEKLQSQFIEASCAQQMREMAEEGIDAGVIFDASVAADAAAPLLLLEGKMGLLALLDEECALPQGSEEAYVTKVLKQLASSPALGPPVAGGGRRRADSDVRLARVQFTVRHFASAVTYTATNWLEKNRGQLRVELETVLAESSSEIAADIFGDHPMRPEAAEAPQLRRGSAQNSATRRGAAPKTVLGKFRLSLRDLSSTLSSTSARYIRCVKPNSAKAARRFDGQFAARQLRYTGVVDVVQVLRRGYPCVIRKTEFYGRYKALLSSIFGAVAVPPGADDDELCRCVLREAQRLLRDPADDDAADARRRGDGAAAAGGRRRGRCSSAAPRSSSARW